MLSAFLGRPETDMTDRKRTPVCELLGIEFPIVEAPVAADPRLPAAVSNAGVSAPWGWGGPMMPEPWFAKRQPLPTGRLPAISFSPGISTIESIRHCRRVCGSCRSSGVIRAATSTRCMTPEGLSCTRSAASRKRGALSDVEWTSSSRRGGKPGAALEWGGNAPAGAGGSHAVARCRSSRPVGSATLAESRPCRPRRAGRDARHAVPASGSPGNV